MIDEVSTQWYLSVLRIALRRCLLRSLSMIAFILFSVPAFAEVGTCVTSAGVVVAPWSDAQDPACGADCDAAPTGCSATSSACEQQVPSGSRFDLEAARAHFKIEHPEPIDAPPSEAPSCRAGAPLCGTGGPPSAPGFGAIVFVLPRADIVPKYAGGLLPHGAEWATIYAPEDYLDRPAGPPPRRAGA